MTTYLIIAAILVLLIVLKLTRFIGIALIFALVVILISRSKLLFGNSGKDRRD